MAPSVVANHSMYETIMFIQCKCWLPSYCAHTVCLFFQFCLLAAQKRAAFGCCVVFSFIFKLTSNLIVIGLRICGALWCMACLAFFVFYSQIDLDAFFSLFFSRFLGVSFTRSMLCITRWPFSVRLLFHFNVSHRGSV